MRANGWPEEPDALIGHVRIRGSPGRVTAPGDPASLVIQAPSPWSDIRQEKVKPVWIARMTATPPSMSLSPAAGGQNLSKVG